MKKKAAVERCGRHKVHDFCRIGWVIDTLTEYSPFKMTAPLCEGVVPPRSVLRAHPASGVALSKGELRRCSRCGKLAFHEAESHAVYVGALR